MISAKMSSAARAATLRPQASAFRAISQGSRAVSYSALPAQTLKLSGISQKNALQPNPLPVSQLVSPFAALPLTRSFHATTPYFQQQQQSKDEKKTDESKYESQEEGGKEGEQKEEEAPPPPHGDKSPWQVFRDTLQTEFKASKEWNESTKALASSAHEFTESENIKRARAAYQAASGAASSRTSSALKTTGQAIGKGAAWTWNTPVVKGVRKGVTATGAGLEKATRPVRETEAYKSVKEAIDDGSSSRYGGWVEKEERRRQRQLREEMEIKSGKRRVERLEEDPK
jgi:mitochondrial import inner membrane translocase subunit TIM44